MEVNPDTYSQDARWMSYIKGRSKLWGGVMKPNYYVRHLNGLSNNSQMNLTRKHLEIAKRVVSKFDLILLLTEMSDLEKRSKLDAFYGLKSEQYPKRSNNYLKSDFPQEVYDTVREKIEKTVRMHFYKDNQLDIELYKYVKNLVKDHEKPGHVKAHLEERKRFNFQIANFLLFSLFLLVLSCYYFNSRRRRCKQRKK